MKLFQGILTPAVCNHSGDPQSEWCDHFFRTPLAIQRELLDTHSTEGITFKDFNNSNLIFEKLLLIDKDLNEVHNLINQPRIIDLKRFERCFG